MSLGSPVQTLRHLEPCSLPCGSSLVPRILCVNRDPGNESILYKCMWCYFTEWIVMFLLFIHSQGSEQSLPVDLVSQCKPQTISAITDRQFRPKLLAHYKLHI